MAWPPRQLESTSHQSPLRAVHRVCDILDTLQEADAAISLSSLARAVDLPKTSAFRYLQSLEARHYVQRTPAGAYVAVPVRPLAPTDVNRLVDSATPYMEKLRDECDETINLAKLEHHYVRYVAIVESRQALRLSARRSDHEALHATALGKAIATMLPESRILSILAHAGMPRLTEHTITEPDRFLAEVISARTLGYAIDNCENESDGICIAVPVIAPPLATALSVSAPTTRLSSSMFTRVADRLRDVAQAIAVDFQDSNSPEILS